MITRRRLVQWPIALTACGGGNPDSPTSTTATVSPSPTSAPIVSNAQAWRPGYHYTPQRHWMNDPNGLVYYGGEYHLYYQYNPQGDQWGNISWGHAVSPDLVTWTELAVAIPNSARVMAFSGSVVIDHDNTGGFAAPGAATPAFVACFTGFDPVSKNQSQHLAYSLDRGRSFTAYAGNPVIDIGSTEFRDPKVFWHAPSRHWVMLVVASLRQEVWIYTASNLRNWTKVSTFGPAGSAAGNIWEVPDLLELPVTAADGSVQGKRWVLVVSVNRGTIWGGSGVQYFIGDFDGSRFVADPHQNPQPAARLVNANITLWADHGRDFYAPLSFANLPDSRVLWLGWMSNWDYASALPTQPWRGQQSLPRALDLATTPQGLRLRQTVVDEVRQLAEAQPLLALQNASLSTLSSALTTAAAQARQFMARLVFDASGLQQPLGLELLKGSSESLRVGFDPAGNSVFVDRRTRSPSFAGQSERHDAPRVLDGAEIGLEIWVDGSTVEVFADGGCVVLSDLVYADAAATGIALFGGDAKVVVKNFELWRVRPSMNR